MERHINHSFDLINLTKLKENTIKSAKKIEEDRPRDKDSTDTRAPEIKSMSKFLWSEFKAAIDFTEDLLILVKRNKILNGV